MKTIKVCITLLMLGIAPFSCSDDDLTIQPINEIASGEAVLELQLEAYALSIDEAVLEQRRDELLTILDEDSGNDNAMGELESVESELRQIVERIPIVASGIVSFGLGPIPPLPPCEPNPENNCPIPIGNVKKLLIDRNTLNFSLEIINPETEDVLFVVEEFNDSEINENLLESRFEIDGEQFPEEVLIEIRKGEGGEDFFYDFHATFLEN